MPKTKIEETSQEARNWTSTVKEKAAGKGALIVMAVLLLGAAGTAGYFYKQFHELKNNSAKPSQDEVNALVKEVGKFMVLPDDEQPTVATVTDPAKLQDQVFFAKAKAGYKVLIYTNAKKAILYDPVGNKIVEVAPINLDGAQSAGTPATQDKSQVPITVINATKTAGLARKIADRLKAAGYSSVTVDESAQDAQQQTTIIFDLKHSGDAEGINSVLNGQAALEAQVSASGVTITLGTDFKAD